MGGIMGERRLTVTQAARRLGVSVGCAWRWVLYGVRGVRLDSIIIGGRRYTSEEALERFAAACTAAADGTAPAPRTPRQREAAIAAAERELAESGI